MKNRHDLHTPKEKYFQNIIILDDSRSRSAYIKMALAKHRFKASLTAYVKELIGLDHSKRPLLVMINQAFKNDSGWDIFNHLKNRSPQIPVMLYHLRSVSDNEVDSIIQSVTSAMEEMNNRHDRQEAPSDVIIDPTRHRYQQYPIQEDDRGAAP